MSTAQLFATLREKGIELVLEGDNLVVDAPAGTLTPDMVEAIRGRKPELMVLLICRHGHVDRALWLDTPASSRPGWIHTTCRNCGAFVGYRPHEGKV